MSAKSIQVGPDVTPKGHRTGKTRVTIPGGPKGHHTRVRVFDTQAEANGFASRLGKRVGVRVEFSGRAAGSTTPRFEKGERVLVRNAKDLQGRVHPVLEGVVVRQKKDGVVTMRYFDPSEESEAYKDVSPSRLERISGRAAGMTKHAQPTRARPTPWRGEDENERDARGHGGHWHDVPAAVDPGGEPDSCDGRFERHSPSRVRLQASRAHGILRAPCVGGFACMELSRASASSARGTRPAWRRPAQRTSQLRKLRGLCALLARARARNPERRRTR